MGKTAKLIVPSPSSAASSLSTPLVASPVAFKPATNATVPPVAVTINSGTGGGVIATSGKWPTGRKILLSIAVLLTAWYIYQKRKEIRSWFRNKNQKARKRKFAVEDFSLEEEEEETGKVQDMHPTKIVRREDGDGELNTNAWAVGGQEEEDDLTELEKEEVQRHVDQICGDVGSQSGFIIFTNGGPGEEPNQPSPGQITELDEINDTQTIPEGNTEQDIPSPVARAASPSVHSPETLNAPAPTGDNGISSTASKLFGKRSRRK